MAEEEIKIPRRPEIEERFICSECNNKGFFLDEFTNVYRCNCGHGRQRPENWPLAMNQTIVWIRNPYYWEEK